jgi:4-amino-4-deoxy-L-arabinose transferase-like glycosyltransferase
MDPNDSGVVNEAGRQMPAPPSPHRLEALEPLAERMSATGLSRMVAVIVGVAALCVVLAGAVALRTVALGHIPAGFNQDEACNGYDAFSLLRTGRDHHGNRWPVLIQAFNDYRMPLFDYSLMVPIELFGLHPGTVRLGAALWGCADIVAVALLAGLLIGLRGAVVAAGLMAVSPWHLPISRFGHEAITASATTTIAMVCYFAALRFHQGRWLLAAALAFGLSLYSYAITKAFVPLIVPWLVILYWRDLKAMRTYGVAALLIIVLCALPQAWALHYQPGAMARYDSMAVLKLAPWPRNAVFMGWSFLYSFDPRFVFRFGSNDVLLHPPGFGQLLAVQAVMVVLAICALLERRYRRSVLFVLGWLAIAAIPGIFILPPLHPLHSILMIVPWTMLSALGMVFLFDLALLPRVIRLAAAVVIVLLVMVQGAQFVSFYFTRYPALAAFQFQYGLGPAVEWIERQPYRGPVVISGYLNQPYIYVLFFGHYPPEEFQHDRVIQSHGLFGRLYKFDRYYFIDPRRAYIAAAHGMFLFSGFEHLPDRPVFSVPRFPGAPEWGGGPAYSVVTK